MAFHVYHRFGQCDANPPLESLEGLCSELELQDNEHIEAEPWQDGYG